MTFPFARRRVPLQFGSTMGMELERTKSVEAPKSTEYVSPLYRSLKNDAKVRPGRTASAL